MAVAVTITGVATVTDDATGKPLADLKRLAKLAKLRESDETIAESFDHDLEELGITGGDIRLALNPSGKTIRVVSTFKAPRRLTKPELARLIDETIGQWSDGIGENCFGEAAKKYGVTIDLRQRGRRPKAEQVDDGKPVKTKKPPSVKAKLAADFVRAAEAGDLNRVKELLAAGVPPDALNKNGINALYAAAAEGRADIVEALLAAGADVNATYEGVCPSALAAAARYADKAPDRNVAVAHRLLAAGADPNLAPTDTDAKSSLSWAVRNHATELVNVLLAAGADPNLRDADTDAFPDPAGMTPLMYVSDAETARLLLEAGADPSLRLECEGRPTAAEYLRATYPHDEDCLAAADLIEQYQRSGGR